VAWCKGCEKEKEETEFYRNCKRKNGRQSQCKYCVDIKKRAYNKNHGEQIRNRRRMWYWNNHEHVLKRHRDWSLGHEAKAKKLERDLKRKLSKTTTISASYVYLRDRGRCHICRGLVKPEEVSLDHLIPVVDGGLTTYENLKLAHRNCNSSRGPDRSGRFIVQLQLLP
jgi:5-methylcytosine-specific restriction endonuclease McrA